VIFTGANDAFFNMALDEALLLSCQQGLSSPILRLFLWNPPGVSIGYFQSARKTVDLKKCKERGIHVVRRITGGRAVLHQDEVTYSVCASSDYFSRLGENISQTYQRISMALLESLRVLGIQGDWVKPSAERRSSFVDKTSAKPCFLSSSRYEITLDGRKLIGSAQRRFSFRSDRTKKESLIQHGSILTGKGEYNLAELLPGGRSPELVGRDLDRESACLEEALGRRAEVDEIIPALKAGFEKVFASRMEDSEVSEQEFKLATGLTESRYLTQEWNLRR
jgi:lipoate-protein ligase A